jgi:Na+-transporting methylmalonyl-CoA/oxaloacetate decarboxylase gamma subunit
MVALRSARRDRWLLAPVWVLTLAVLGVGIALVVPILIFWGAVGLIGAVFATRVLLRDVRSEAAAADEPEPAAAADEEKHR